MMWGSEHPRLTPIRITLLGASKVGKTSLASAFVNNFTPQIYTKTEEAGLYYKTIEIPSEGGKKFPVLVEIEDACAWTWTERPKENQKPTEAEKVIVQRRRNMAHPQGGMMKALKGTRDARRERTENPGKENDLFSPFDMKTDKYIPIARRRMAFLVVFNPGDEETLAKAKDAVNAVFDLAKEANKELPKVILVATNMDMGETDVAKTLKEADNFAKGFQFEKIKGFPFEKLATSNFQQVRKLFRKLLETVQKDGELWKEWDEAERNMENSPSTRSPTMAAYMMADSSEAAAAAAGQQDGQGDCVLQ